MINVSLVIATRNRAPQLKLCLESLALRGYPLLEDMEIVLVDDASTDETGDVISKSRIDIKYVRIARGGGYSRNPGHVFNVGHASACGDVVIEQGSEVCHLTDCVSSLLAECRPGVVALARVYHGSVDEMALLTKDIDQGQYRFLNDFEPSTITRTNGDHWIVPRVGNREIQLYCGVERPAPFIFCGAIHRKDFEAVGGYNENLSARNDEDLANRLLATGVRFKFIGRAVAFHLKHGKS